MDAALPFGLRLAPKIFSALAVGLLWMLHSRGADRSLHYLDDFLLMGHPESRSCLDGFLALCEELGVPVAPEKMEGPATMLNFLGVREIDMVAMQLWMSQEKLRDLVAR